MKSMLVLLFGLFLAAPLSGKEAASNYSQSYVIMIKGAPAGSETVVEKRDASGDTVSTSDHELLVSDGVETKRMTFSTRMVLSKRTGIPSSYSYWYTSGNTGDSYEVTIRDGQVTRVLTRGGRSSEATIPLVPEMVFVDFNVYHQYDYLIRRYDMKKGGRQTFADFIPLIGNDIPVAVNYMGESKVDVKGTPIVLRTFRIEFVGIWGGTLMVDKDGRMVQLLIPNQEIEVIRRDLAPTPK